jgi:hypothetical protein
MMKLLQQWVGLGLLCVSSPSIFANTPDLTDALEAELSVLLNAKQSAYIPQADPKLEKQLAQQAKKSNYQVSWIKRPKIEFTDGDYKGYKNPVLMRMTVLADDGRIVKSEVVRSSGSKSIDQKLIQALASAQLEGIPNMERNVIYSFIHEFSINNS